MVSNTQNELEELQETYDIAMQEIARLRKKLGYTEDTLNVVYEEVKCVECEAKYNQITVRCPKCNSDRFEDDEDYLNKLGDELK